MIARSARQRNPAAVKHAEYELRLYLAGSTPKSLAAVSNLRAICEEYLAGRFAVTVIDLAKHPELARADQILALPTLVRGLPEPVRKIIGDLSDTERVLVGLDVRPGSGPAPGA